VRRVRHGAIRLGAFGLRLKLIVELKLADLSVFASLIEVVVELITAARVRFELSDYGGVDIDTVAVGVLIPANTKLF